MAERKRLMTIWRQGVNAPSTNLLRSVDGLGYAIHHYIVDGSAVEALLWVEGADTPRISDEPGEVFTLTLAREVGARPTTPWTERTRSLFRNTRRKMCALQG
jgi:hypothetical protein